MAKRVLIFTNHFYPENFKVNDIAFYLANKGYYVHIVTCIPNYPGGKFFKGYGFFKKRHEVVRGVKISRLPLIPRGSGTEWQLFLNYSSYLLTSSLYSIILCFRKKYDIVFVHETSPVTIAIPALIYKFFRKVPVIMWVLDLWPESIMAASNFSNTFFIRIIKKLVSIIYKSCDFIFISSKGFFKKIVEAGTNPSKIEYLPNWAEDVFFKSSLRSLNFNLDSSEDFFTIMYTGNLGDSQDFELIMEAALLLKEHEDIKFVFVGDGRRKGFIETFIQEHSLHRSVFLLGYHPIESMPEFMKQSDALLISLKDEPIFKLTVPAKLQSYMASGKPVIGFISGEAAEIIKEAKCGVVSECKTAKSLTQAILKLKAMDKSELKELGENSKKYFLENFVKVKLLKKLENKLKQYSCSAKLTKPMMVGPCKE